MNMAPCLFDVAQEGFELLLPVCIDRNIIVLGQQGVIVDEMHIDEVLMGRNFSVPEREGSFPQRSGLFDQEVLDSDLFDSFPVEEAFPGHVLSENQIKDEAEIRNIKENHEPSPCRPGISPFKEDDDGSEHQVEEE